LTFFAHACVTIYLTDTSFHLHLKQEITDELNDLNKIKSQMVWLLKQVRYFF